MARARRGDGFSEGIIAGRIGLADIVGGSGRMGSALQVLRRYHLQPVPLRVSMASGIRRKGSRTAPPEYAVRQSARLARSMARVVTAPRLSAASWSSRWRSTGLRTRRLSSSRAMRRSWSTSSVAVGGADGAATKSAAAATAAVGDGLADGIVGLTVSGAGRTRVTMAGAAVVFCAFGAGWRSGTGGGNVGGPGCGKALMNTRFRYVRRIPSSGIACLALDINSR